MLMIKVVKDMLAIFKKNPEAYYNGDFAKINSLDELRNISTLVTLFEARHKALLMRLINRMLELKSQGHTNYDILMFNVSDEIQ